MHPGRRAVADLVADFVALAGIRNGEIQIVPGQLRAGGFCFVGGSEREYINYFTRDLPSGLWDWALEEEVQACCGFSVVDKKRK